MCKESRRLVGYQLQGCVSLLSLFLESCLELRDFCPLELVIGFKLRHFRYLQPIGFFELSKLALVLVFALALLGEHSNEILGGCAHMCRGLLLPELQQLLVRFRHLRAEIRRDVLEGLHCDFASRQQGRQLPVLGVILVDQLLKGIQNAACGIRDPLTQL